MLSQEDKSRLEKLWEAFASGGIVDALTVIQQISYLIFIKRLDDNELARERHKSVTGKSSAAKVFRKDEQALRWHKFKDLSNNEMFKLMRDEVFPFVQALGEKASVGSAFSRNMQNAVFMIQKPSLLATAVSIISKLDFDDKDTSGDFYEHLLRRLKMSGRNGQFRTPRHIIAMMVEVLDPRPMERICDPACGTAGFLMAAANHILKTNTSEKYIERSENGSLSGLIGDGLSKKEHEFYQEQAFTGHDFDESMLRVAAMNLWLHGVDEPNIRYADTLASTYSDSEVYDVILANPPFKGSLDYDDVHRTLLAQVKTKKTELLFVSLFLRLLNIGGRAAVIVPDGVLFGSQKAHVSVRKMLIEDNQLEGVISMPSGVFRPYAGVSTGILIFTKGGATDRVWFYEMSADGFSLDDKRNPISENDIPDLLACWKNQADANFNAAREKRRAALKTDFAPLKKRRLEYQAEISRLTFENVMEGEEDEKLITERDKVKASLAILNDKIKTLQDEHDMLNRQFWVNKKAIVENKYDLTASRYRRLEQEEMFYEKPATTLRRLGQLNDKIQQGEKALLEALR